MEVKIPEDGMKPDIYFFFALENGVPFMPFSLPLKSPCMTFLPEISLINIDACTCADGTTIIYLW